MYLSSSRHPVISRNSPSKHIGRSIVKNIVQQTYFKTEFDDKPDQSMSDTEAESFALAKSQLKRDPNQLPLTRSGSQRLKPQDMRANSSKGLLTNH